MALIPIIEKCLGNQQILQTTHFYSYEKASHIIHETQTPPALQIISGDETISPIAFETAWPKQSPVADLETAKLGTQEVEGN